MDVNQILNDIEAAMLKMEQYNRLGEDEKAAFEWAKIKEGVAAIRAAQPKA